MRWQEERREQMKGRLAGLGIETGFEEEDEGVSSEMSEEMGGGGAEGEGEDGIDDMFEVPGGALQVLQ